MTPPFTLAVTGQSLIKHDIRQDQSTGYAAVRDLLKAADLAFTNFESTVAGRHGGWPTKGYYFGSSAPHMLDALREAGFNALSLSNNHAFDLGPAGVLSTLDEVTARDYLHAGIGRTLAEATGPARGTIGGRAVALIAMDGGPGPDTMYAEDAAPPRPARPGVNRLRLHRRLEVDPTAFDQLARIRDLVGYTDVDLINDSQPDDPPRLEKGEELGFGGVIFRKSPGFGRRIGVDPADQARNLAAISQAASKGDLVVAYLHHHYWATDWLQQPEWIGSFARQCIDTGAALFASHGAPVLQPIEIYKGRPIFYSLGNFIFHVSSASQLWHRREVWESVVGECRFDASNTLTGMVLHPVLLGGEKGQETDRLEARLVPQRVTGASAERILRKLVDQSAAYGTVIEIRDGTGHLRLT